MMLSVNFSEFLKCSMRYMQYSGTVVNYWMHKISKLNEPGHEKMCLMSYANNKCADNTAQISAFVVRCLDSIISLDSIAEISRL